MAKKRGKAPADSSPVFVVKVLSRVDAAARPLTAKEIGVSTYLMDRFAARNHVKTYFIEEGRGRPRKKYVLSPQGRIAMQLAMKKIKEKPKLANISERMISVGSVKRQPMDICGGF